jgi:hypothetical protein
MGGLHSGRTRRHTCIDDCLTIDTAWLRKQKILGEQVSVFSIKWKHWTETNFSKRREHLNEVAAYYLHGEHPTLSLHYRTVASYDDGRPKQEHSHKETISLESTPCNYGSVRWWFTAPCCGRRVRVLYINQKIGNVERMTPQCRECLELHYVSQLQSYIERHKTYERYLLANYGYAWAEIEYHCLREHYQKITPELEYARQRSILDMRMRMLRHLMSFTRLILRMHMRDLRSLKSEEDRQMYLDHVRKEHGESYALDLVRMLGISFQMERDARHSSSEVFDEAYNQVTKQLTKTLESDEWLTDSGTRQAISEASENAGKMNLRYLLAYKQQLEEDIEELEKMKPAA